MGNIEVTEAQRKKCTQCKHRALMPKDKNKNIYISVCTAQPHKYEKCKHKEAIQNYWNLVLECLEKRYKKEVKEIQSYLRDKGLVE